MVVSKKEIHFILSAALISNVAQAQPIYSEIHQAGINYIIATVGIEELYRTECGYVFKKLDIKPFKRKREAVLLKFTEVDKLEVRQKINELSPELKSFFDEVIAKFKTSSDKNFFCGIVAGEAIKKLREAQLKLNRVTN